MKITDLDPKELQLRSWINHRCAGLYSYVTLPRRRFAIPIPYILVTTAYDGVAPEDMESSVTMKIEKELNGIRA